ncbi:MAG: MotA/TolQ/ExbB proton channel family protein [Anaerocolumna aminovalerica]|uniref:motility protein A n=1 Tax=Anaerocolumna aminovalerica TaxID=1527 RepID=UPI00280C1639|nr:MotA/TolQ/ExbB proton channel family protein [Anaerocolumna aminovalerica]MDU6263136.1 MotA/TolQ/ExbB proton channel family protein [Anaerocolumna aminovalerica]
MSRIAKTTIIGLILNLGFMLSGIVTSGQPWLFWNVPSFFIIVGGTIGSFVMAFPPSQLKTVGGVMKKAFKKDEYNIEEDIAALVKLAEISRREGLLTLEDHIDQYTDDEFVKRGIMLIVDGADEEQLRNLLEGATYFMKQRHQKGAAMLDMIAATAPALGLVGTYVGLIPMLTNLDDPTSLGPNMALELVSSFYGGFIANIIFGPLAKRLKIMSKEEATRRDVLIEGIAAIQQGKNPKLIKEELYAYANLSLEEPEVYEEKEIIREREAASQL